MDTGICITDSLCCTTETITLSINDTLVKKKKFFKSEEGHSECPVYTTTCSVKVTQHMNECVPACTHTHTLSDWGLPDLPRAGTKKSL